MAKLTALPEQYIIDGFKGTIDFYVHKDIPCARRWPKHPAMPRSPDSTITSELFGYMAKLTSSLPPVIRQAAAFMAIGQPRTFRDILMSAYFGRLFVEPPVPDSEL